MKNLIKQYSVLAACLALSAFGEISARTYEIWEPEPAPNNGRSRWEATKSGSRPNSYDADWETLAAHKASTLNPDHLAYHWAKSIPDYVLECWPKRIVVE